MLYAMLMYGVLMLMVLFCGVLVFNSVSVVFRRVGGRGGAKLSHFVAIQYPEIIKFSRRVH
jgi:hypothetical protein